MSMRGDDAGRRRGRGVSEAAGVAVLVALAVGVTGVAILAAVSIDDGTDASFSFDSDGDGDGLTITYEAGPELVAGELTVTGPGGRVDWATLAGVAPEATVSPGSAQRIGPETAYGIEVLDRDRIEIVYTEDGEDVLAVREPTT